VIARRFQVSAALFAAVAMLGGCSSGDDVSVDAVRKAAGPAQPGTCPIGVDVPAAVKSGGVDRPTRLASADTTLSTGDKPADVPLTAIKSGVSPLEAAAGAHIECEYQVDKDTLRIRLVATRAQKAALPLIAPQISRDGKLKLKDLEGVLNAPPEPGDVTLVNGSVAIARLGADEGDAALVVSSTAPDLHDDALSSLTGTLVSQLNF
jgi:hypothetical protein